MDVEEDVKRIIGILKNTVETVDRISKNIVLIRRIDEINQQRIIVLQKRMENLERQVIGDENSKQRIE